MFTADELRRAFLDFFVARGHTEVPSASVIPVDKTLLFTVAGMVPFKPYFTGEEPAPYAAGHLGPEVRAGRRQAQRPRRHRPHQPALLVLRDARQLQLRRLLQGRGDPVRRGSSTPRCSVSTSTASGSPSTRTTTRPRRSGATTWASRPSAIQRLGEDNFWRMGDTGPCGPSSEIFWDLGERFGPDGGPAHGAEDRYIEIWNLVFMQYDQQPDGTRVPLPKPSIDTGAGLERNLVVLQDVDSMWDIDVFRPLIAAAEQATGATYGTFPGTDSDVSLRILAEHARTMTFMVADGVRPSNKERGYVLRRIIRRAVRHAYLLGARDARDARPRRRDGRHDGRRLPRARDAVRPRARGRRARGGALPRHAATRCRHARRRPRRGRRVGRATRSSCTTRSASRSTSRARSRPSAGAAVDLDGFEAAMDEQRTRAREAHKAAGGRRPRPSSCTARCSTSTAPPSSPAARSTRPRARRCSRCSSAANGSAQADATSGPVDVVLDRTPFYAESGGQVGDTGTITTASRRGRRVTDTQYAIPGPAHVHRVAVRAARSPRATRSTPRSTACAATHPPQPHRHPHAALGAARGARLARAAGRVVRRPDRLRFDFSHHEAVTPDQLVRRSSGSRTSR